MILRLIKGVKVTKIWQGRFLVFCFIILILIEIAICMLGKKVYILTIILITVYLYRLK
jgi:hypothetical protein